MRERREDPVDRMMDDTFVRKSTDIRFAIARGRAFGRGYWLGYASAATCSLIWITLDLWSRGLLLGMGG